MGILLPFALHQMDRASCPARPGAPPAARDRYGGGKDVPGDVAVTGYLADLPPEIRP